MIPTDALQLLKKQKKTAGSAEVSRIFEVWYNKKGGQSAIQLGTAAALQATLNQSSDKGQYYNEFVLDVNLYFQDKQNLNQLAVKWSLLEIGDVSLIVDQELPNPNWTVSLYAVRTAPQLGLTLNGSPLFGYGLNGEQYTIEYSEIEDTYTTLLTKIT